MDGAPASGTARRKRLIEQNMNVEVAPAKKRPPICGIGSLVAPFLAFGFAMIFLIMRGQGKGWDVLYQNALLSGIIFLLGLIAGVLTAVIGVCRKEKYPLLAFIGLMLNVTLLAICVIARFS